MSHCNKFRDGHARQLLFGGRDGARAVLSLDAWAWPGRDVLWCRIPSKSPGLQPHNSTIASTSSHAFSPHLGPGDLDRSTGPPEVGPSARSFDQTVYEAGLPSVQVAGRPMQLRSTGPHVQQVARPSGPPSKTQ
ncbi:unnamed protein product, partial [Protopolystoma xenopodis]